MFEVRRQGVTGPNSSFLFLSHTDWWGDMWRVKGEKSLKATQHQAGSLLVQGCGLYRKGRDTTESQSVSL